MSRKTLVGNSSYVRSTQGGFVNFPKINPSVPWKASRMPRPLSWGPHATPTVTVGPGDGRSYSGGSRALRGRQQLNHLYPLSRREVLAQVSHAVHGHLWVFLNQTTGNEKDRRRLLTPSSVSLGGSVLVQDTMLLLSGPEPRVLTSSCCAHTGKGEGRG